MASANSITSPKEEHKFLVLDALRGVAAISVTIYHFMGNLTGFQRRGLPNADLAVDFFFILSGFVIAYAYEKRILAGQTVRQFMTRRLIRLYPMYLLGITLPMVIYVAKNVVANHGVSSSAFPIPYLFEFFFLPTPAAYLPEGPDADLSITNIFPLNHPSWSLSLEIGINLVFVLLCRRLKTPRLYTLVGLSAIAFGTASYMSGTIDLGWSWPSYAGGWTRVFFTFFTGMLLYRLYTSKKRTPVSLWLGIFLAVFLVLDFACNDTDLVYQLGNCLIVLPLAVWLGARSKVWEPAHRVYVWLGRTSYSLYIIHMPLMPIFMLIAQKLKLDPQANLALTVGAFTVLSLVVAGILDVLYDIPVRSLLTKKFVSRKTSHH